MNLPPPPPPPPRTRAAIQNARAQGEVHVDLPAPEEEEEETIIEEEEETIIEEEESEDGGIEEDDIGDDDEIQQVVEEPLRLHSFQERTRLEQRPLETHDHKMAVLHIRSLSGERLQILVTSDMLQEDLGRSIVHAALSPSEGMRLLESWSCDEGVTDWSRIAGLFREHDGVFIPLSILLHDCKTHEHDVFRVSRRPARQLIQKAPSNPSFKREILLYLIITVYVGYKCSSGRDINVISDQCLEMAEMCLGYIINLPFQIVETCIDYPLKELYRYGPSVVGWEGQSLSNVCSQITHMGDESFWSRNVDECQKIYDTKELAALHFRRPLVFLFLAFLAFLVIRSLIHTWAIRQQNRPHPEMVEIYQTFKMLMKVLHRGLNGRDDERRRNTRRR